MMPSVITPTQRPHDADAMSASSSRYAGIMPYRNRNGVNQLRRTAAAGRTGLQIFAGKPGHPITSHCRAAARLVAARAAPSEDHLLSEAPSTDVEYDAIIIGSGMGGLATAAQMVTKGAKVLVLEKYTIPGGSAGHFKRDGYTFDVGSSMMFGFGDQGTTNLITKCLQSVGKRMATVPDPTQVHYHLPKSSRFPEGFDIQVWHKYEDFLEELTSKFPHEREGIKAFYDECWKVFNSLNTIELKSLEEPRYLAAQLLHSPLSCLNLATWLTSNTGEVARRHIRDPELLRFIDLECFTYSTVNADHTPMVTSGMVLSDRHYGGVRYPVGGIGRIAVTVAEGVEEHGGRIVYKANVKDILMEEAAEGGPARAVGVRLADGRQFRARTVISNATRWDTFEGMVGEQRLPESERLFRQRYQKAPSFFSLHLGVRAGVLPEGTDCHHIILDDWEKLELARGAVFVSMPSLLDPSLAPAGHHVVHAFTPDWIDAWQNLSPQEYTARKEQVADELIARMERVFPGIAQAVTFRDIGTPRTHRRFLNRSDGTYGPIPGRPPMGIITMPFNSTDIPGLYCVGDSTFPGQGVNAVVFSGFSCAHRVLCDLGMAPRWHPLLDDGWRNLVRLARVTASQVPACSEPVGGAEHGVATAAARHAGEFAAAQMHQLWEGILAAAAASRPSAVVQAQEEAGAYTGGQLARKQWSNIVPFGRGQMKLWQQQEEADKEETEAASRRD